MSEPKTDYHEIEIRRFIGGFVGLREKGNSQKAYLVLSDSEWRSWLLRIKRGELDVIDESLT